MRKIRLLRHLDNPILSPRPSISWEAGSVLNPGAVDVNGTIHLLYRGTTSPFGVAGSYTSSVGLATSPDGLHFTAQEDPLITTTEDFESGLGCEDARVARLGEGYYIFYNAVRRLPDDSLQIGVALATTVDFRQVVKHGLILSTSSPSIRIKAAAPFELTHGKVGLAFTVAAESPLSSIMYLEFPSAQALKQPVPSEVIGRLLTHYDDHILLAPSTPVERGPELGSAPVKTRDGWILLITPSNPGPERRWQIGALLLDLKNPRRVIGYLPDLLMPETEQDLAGVARNVIFTCGAVIRDDELYVYYGSGDEVCNLATIKLQTLIFGLKTSPLPSISWPY